MRPTVSLGRTPDGRRLLVSRTVDAPASVVWDLFTDTRAWPSWGPSVSAVDCPVETIEAGTTGRVRVAGVWVPFEVTTCDGTRWTWRVADVPATGHRVDALSPTQCRATFEVPLAAAPYVVVCDRALSRLARLATSD